jgi:hypothetical protein
MNMPPPHRPRGPWRFKPIAPSGGRTACRFARPGMVSTEHSHPCDARTSDALAANINDCMLATSLRSEGLLLITSLHAG